MAKSGQRLQHSTRRSRGRGTLVFERGWDASRNFELKPSKGDQFRRGPSFF